MLTKELFAYVRDTISPATSSAVSLPADDAKITIYRILKGIRVSVGLSLVNTSKYVAPGTLSGPSLRRLLKPEPGARLSVFIELQKKQ